MGLTINVQIVSASNVGGTYPFVVVCFDNDLDNEVYKTAAANGGMLAVWNESFQIDLSTHIKRITDEGKPEPTYLTFFMFDTGAQSIPSLGSAGVLLSNLRDSGMSKGDFPVVNGTGTLALIVSLEEEQDNKWYQTKTAKVAGAVGVGAATALAAGFTAMKLNQKKKNGSNPSDKNSSTDGKKKKTKFSLPGRGNRSLQQHEDEDDDDHHQADNPRYTYDDEEDDDDSTDHPAGHNVNNGADTASAHRRGAGNTTSGRKWWDPITDDEEDAQEDHDEEDDDQHDMPGGQSRAQPPHQSYPPYQPSSQPSRYEGGGVVRGNNARSGEDGDHESSQEAPEFQHHLRAREEPGEYGGIAYAADDGHPPQNYDA